MPILECDNLTKRFGSVEALTDVSFSVEPGRIVGLLGPTGSGKTPMIKLINGLRPPTSGQVRSDGGCRLSSSWTSTGTSTRTSGRRLRKRCSPGWRSRKSAG